MLCKMLRLVNPVCLQNLLFTSVVICPAIFVPACTQDSAKHARGPIEGSRSVELREAEYKTAQHPEKKYFATILPDGLRVSFHTAQGHFGSYTFPHKEFPPGEPVFLLCPGSPDLLPLRVALIKGDNDDLNDYHDYKIEWLAESPATSEGARKVVRSY